MTATSPPVGKEAIRIANCSGFFGDRLSAAREMVEDGPIDVLTGDWLAELTMLILARQKMKHGNGYARTFMTQMEQVLGTCVDRRIKVVSNAGGLDPQGLATALAELAGSLGVEARIAVVTGDDLMPHLAALVAAGEAFVNLDTDETLEEVRVRPMTANAYLGAEPIAAALLAGADVVVTGRVTDAALVIGPAAWHHGWDFAAARRGDQATLDSLAGALVAGHVIECGAQATGGNYAFFTDVPGMEHPGLPIAEVAADGSSVITKHDGTGGMVTVGTVTAQLLYEIGDERYLNPDVTARFDTIALEQVGRDRVLVSGTRGELPPERLKVVMNYLGGFRNTLTLVLTGGQAEAKADLALRTIAGVTLQQARELAPSALAAASRFGVREFAAELQVNGMADPPLPGDAQSFLRLTVKDPDAALAGKPFTEAVIESSLSCYPGIFPTTPPGPASPFGVYWPTTVGRDLVGVDVLLDGEPLLRVAP
jgi:hypothetical protein